jgi:hypothetical protein
VRDNERDKGKERERADRRESREKRRAKREKMSTLLSEKYDSPLRRWLRWMSAQGLSGSSLFVGLVAVGVVKSAVGMGGFSGEHIFRTPGRRIVPPLPDVIVEMC